MKPPNSVTVGIRSTPCTGSPPIFTDAAHAIRWAVSQGAFSNVEEATEAYNALQQNYLHVYPFWLREVARRLQTRRK